MITSPPPPGYLNRAAGFLGACGALLAGAVALLQPVPGGPTPGGHGGSDDHPYCTLRPDGFLRGRFFGALDLAADWAGRSLLCDGMSKPGGGGVRLFFEGAAPGGGRVAVVIGIEGGQALLVGAERPANVTVMDRRNGRFFSSRGPGRCWASIDSVTPLPADVGPRQGNRISGLVYCVGSLPSVGDGSSLTLGDLHFAGRIGGDDA